MSFKRKYLKTGEIVRVIGWNGEDDKRRKTDWVSYIDSKGVEHEMVKGLNFHWDFDDIDTYELMEEREHERNINSHFCMFAGMAMQGIVIQGKLRNEKMIAESSVKIAKELTEELAKWKVDVKKDIVFREDNEQEEQEETTKD